MSLILSIFALVYNTERVSWIGKSVFLQFGRAYALCIAGFRDLTHVPRHGQHINEFSTGMQRNVSES